VGLVAVPSLSVIVAVSLSVAELELELELELLLLAVGPVEPVPSVAELLPLISLSLPTSEAVFDAEAVSVADSETVTVTEVELALAAVSVPPPLHPVRTVHEARAKRDGYRGSKGIPRVRRKCFICELQMARYHRVVACLRPNSPAWGSVSHRLIERREIPRSVADQRRY